MAGREIDNETWLEFDYAVGEIERRLGVSNDAAKARLRCSCRDGDIVSWSKPPPPAHEEEEEWGWTEIPLDVWENHDVDCEEFPEGTHDVRVSEADFEHWLKQQRVSKEPKQKSARPRDIAGEVIEAIWPKRDIPKTVSNAQIEQQVGKRLKELGRSEISGDTILRAAGRK
jgi:hypothetical protein